MTVAGGALAAVLAIASAHSGVLAAPDSSASVVKSSPDLPSAADIVAKSIAASGGLAAWRQIRSMIWIGHIESAHAPVPSMRFVLSQEWPNKTRFEVSAMGQTNVRIFDGQRGFKIGATSNGGLAVAPYDAEETQFAQAAQVIGGPLLDYADRGSQVALEGDDRIDGREAYVINVQLADGEIDHVWVDTTTYLERRLERTRFAPGGKRITVAMDYHDYHTVGGLHLPYLIETAGGGSLTPDRIQIEQVLLNPPIDGRQFEPPNGAPAAGMRGDPR